MNSKKLLIYLALLVLPFTGFFITKGSDFSQLGEVTSTPTSTPTLRNRNYDQLLDHIQELISTNYGCNLPCFGGLEMGSSTTNDIDDFTRKIDYRNIISNQLKGELTYSFWLLFGNVGNGGLLTVALSTEDKVLQQAHIGLTRPNTWLNKDVFDLQNVITNLGTPDNIYMLISGPPLGFTMVLVYNDKGVLVRYEANFIQQTLNGNEPLNFCFSPDKIDLYQIDAWLQNPNYSSLVEDNQPDLHDTSRETRPFWPLEKFMGINEAEFTRILTEKAASCFEGLSLNELMEQGYQY